MILAVRKWVGLAAAGIVVAGLSGCGPKAEAPEPASAEDTAMKDQGPATARNANAVTPMRPSDGIVSMADTYIVAALTKPMDKLYMEAKASQSKEASFRLGLALLAGRKTATISDAEFKAEKAEPKYWLDRAKPKPGAAAPSEPAGPGEEEPLTSYVFNDGVACVADLRASLKAPASKIAVDQAKDSCWGEPAYERYKAELSKHP